MKLIFLIFIVIIFILNEKKNLIEPTILSCCGGMNKNRGDYKETDTKPPKKWKRCFKKNEWDSFPCTTAESNKCCGGKGKCRPTRYGGKCELNDRSSGSKFFIYDEDGLEQDYGPEQEKNDRDTYEGEDEEGDTASFERHNDLSSMFYIVCFVFMFVLLGVLVYYFLSKNKTSKTKTSPTKYYNKYN
jgi:hypothetical protein